MSSSLLPKFGLLFGLIAFPALAREFEEKLQIRTLQVPAHPGQEAPSIYVSGQVASVLRFEQDVDVAKTRLLAWEGRFEPLLVGSKKVVVEPLRELDEGEALPLHVTLTDGTEFTFLVRPKRSESWGWIDYQVNVFKDQGSYNAVLSGLYDALNRERELREENERFKKEENSVDHAYATLLANGEVGKTPFRRKRFFRLRNEDMDMVVEVFKGPGKAAAVVTLRNTVLQESWRFEGASVTRDLSLRTARPFALRMDRTVIVPGQSGRIAVVVDRSSFELEGGQLADLALQIFRGDGLLQVAVAMEQTLVRQ
ncbi:DUF2381 family protein [Corallococcus carmarthensis]|uniref:DUF2381 family protein n=1 Tax=Corallococcus carmarthensis TaxID=2316728 RepID=A0A3A8JHZ0_9BACT|nr:DUF2381 family protein [Corallococcus carmarthensis]RKG94945.1 DUF2381 family protein [Corallococcus carmarthensis]